MIAELNKEPLRNRNVMSGYMKYLVGRFFKILPIRESESDSLAVYMTSLQAELIGYKNLNVVAVDNPSFISLICILQYLIDNPDEPVSAVKREVFRAISICNKLVEKYSDESASEVISE